MGARCCFCGTKVPELDHDLNINNIDILEEVQDIRQMHSKQLKNSKIYHEDEAIFRGNKNKNNERQGYGEYFLHDKAFFGIYLRGLPNGLGLAIKDDNNYYRGHFKNGIFDGYGKQFGPNYTFQGEFHRGFRKKGLFKNDKLQYRGDFHNNTFHGKGVVIFSNGTRYQGSFARGQMNGKGVIVFSNGKIFKGQMINGQCSQGQFQWAKGISMRNSKSLSLDQHQVNIQNKSRYINQLPTSASKPQNLQNPVSTDRINFGPQP